MNIYFLAREQTYTPSKYSIEFQTRMLFENKGNNKITELRTILQRESPNS